MVYLGRIVQRDLAARELDDALYYLREGCQPCAQRQLTLARRFGATERQIAAVKLAGSCCPGRPPTQIRVTDERQSTTRSWAALSLAWPGPWRQQQAHGRPGKQSALLASNRTTWIVR